MNKDTKLASGAVQSAAIQHPRIATGLSYDAAIRAFERELGRLDPALTQRLVERKAPWSEVEPEIGAIGSPYDSVRP